MRSTFQKIYDRTTKQYRCVRYTGSIETGHNDRVPFFTGQKLSDRLYFYRHTGKMLTLGVSDMSGGRYLGTDQVLHIFDGDVVEYYTGSPACHESIHIWRRN